MRTAARATSERRVGVSRCAAALALALWWAASATAQTPEAEPAAPAPPEAIAFGEIGQRLQALTGRLDAITAARPTELLDRSREALEGLLAEVEPATTRADALLARRYSPAELRIERLAWDKLRGDFDALLGDLGDGADDIDDYLDEIDELDDVWQATLDRARENDAPGAVQSQAREALRALAAAKTAVGRDLAAIVDLEAQIAKSREAMRPLDARFEAAERELTAGILTRQDPPFWQSIPSGEGLAAVAAEVVEQLAGAWEELGAYLARRFEPILVELVFFAFVGWALLRVRQRSAQSAEPSETIADTLRHPWAAAFLMTALLTNFLQPERVRGFRFGVVTLAVVAWLRVLGAMAATALWRPLSILAAIAWLEVFRNLVSGSTAADRALLAFNLAAALAWAVWLPRRGHLAHRPWGGVPGAWSRFLDAWIKVLGPGLAVGLLATLLGYTNLANRVAVVGIIGTIGGSAWLIVARIAEAVVEYEVEHGALGSLRFVQHSKASVLRFSRAGLRALGLFAWIYLTLLLAGFWTPVRDAVGALLAGSIGYGSVSVSLGGILAFGATLWIAWLLSRVISFAVSESLENFRAPPGVPFALATFSRYAILVIGFVAAVSAVGFPIDRMTLLLSAVGVGIGFGLQNVTNHFVSGIVLLFERPIRLGDTVQLDTTTGVVKSIGIRASTIRTWDGADLIVPNGDFISSRVINWTFADRNRRVILPVGVAYGTDPQKVIDLLLEVARGHPQVSNFPTPVCLFRGFGDSSLDFELRVFTESDWLEVMSDLGVAVEGALRDAGITIPFPQRDVHHYGSDASPGPTPSPSGSADPDRR